MQTWNEVAFNELAIPVILFLPSKEKQRKLDSFEYSIVLIVDWMMTRMGARSGSVNILNTLGSGLTSQQSLAWIEHAAIQTDSLPAHKAKEGLLEQNGENLPMKPFCVYLTAFNETFTSKPITRRRKRQPVICGLRLECNQSIFGLVALNAGSWSPSWDQAGLSPKQ